MRLKISKNIEVYGRTRRGNSRVLRLRRSINHGVRLTVVPGANGVSELRSAYGSALWLLLAMTGLVLLMACVNLMNLCSLAPALGSRKSRSVSRLERRADV